MSSIYKKGRDGYYYYQTYVYNPDTKKKDKRIFHALRTKDLTEAQEKQTELDLEYKHQELEKPDASWTARILGAKISTIKIIATIVAIIFVINIIVTKPLKAIRDITTTSEQALTTNNDNTVLNDIKSTVNNKIDLNKEYSTEKTENSKPQSIQPTVGDKIDLNKKYSSTKVEYSESKSVKPEIMIPEHTVERIEKLSDSFGQGKVYVTVDKNSSKESKRLLCMHLMKKYSEFSNIIICLYANNQSGIELAKGYDKNVSVEEQKQSWLAMYTYNKVEGEYFDDNPSGYLGIY